MSDLRRLGAMVVFSLAANAAILAGLIWSRPAAPATPHPVRVSTVRARLAPPAPPETPPAPVDPGPAPAIIDIAPVPPAPSEPLASRPDRSLRVPVAARLSTLRPLGPPRAVPALGDLPVPAAPLASSSAADQPRAVAATPPIPLEPLDPARFYPPLLRRRGVTGRTRLRVRVDARGRAEPAEILASTRGFDAAAERMVRAMRFIPATRAGEAVAGMRILTVVWRLEDER